MAALMANSISLWYSTILQWAHFSRESVRIKYPGLQKLESERAGSGALSPEEEIIIQMAKESPTLFMT
jgi:hypothetical protein